MPMTETQKKTLEDTRNRIKELQSFLGKLSNDARIDEVKSMLAGYYTLLESHFRADFIRNQMYDENAQLRVQLSKKEVKKKEVKK